MRKVRLKETKKPFIKGQLVEVFQEKKDGLYLRGANLAGEDAMKNWSARVVAGPFKPEDVE
jgi:hypothetical protein